MRQSTCRALLVLALLVPLSSLSFGDTVSVGGTAAGSGDEESATIILNSVSFEFSEPFDWGGFGALVLPGTDVLGGAIWGLEKFQDWSFDGFSGGVVSATINFVSDPFTFPEGTLYATGIPDTWNAQIDLVAIDSGTTLFVIDASGVGTASFGLNPTFHLVYGETSLDDGTARVVYEDPSVPEPSTLTLMGIAGIASIFVIGFRRRYSNAN